MDDKITITADLHAIDIEFETHHPTDWAYRVGQMTLTPAEAAELVIALQDPATAVNIEDYGLITIFKFENLTFVVPAWFTGVSMWFVCDQHEINHLINSLNAALTEVRV